MCYFLYWLIQFPFMFVSPHQIRWLFLAKAIIVPPTWVRLDLIPNHAWYVGLNQTFQLKLSMLIWAFVKVPPSSPDGLITEHTSLSGASLSWAWLSALNSALGIYATLGVNIPDFTVSRIHDYNLLQFLTHVHSVMQRTNARTPSFLMFKLVISNIPCL